jgi:CDGSH-type Zn-finger protein
VSFDVGDRRSDRPLAVRLPIGLEQPVAPEVVQALVLAGCEARRDGRVEADAADLVHALAALLGETSVGDSVPAPGSDIDDGIVRVIPYRDGPYLLRGPFALTDQDGNDIATRRSTIALCRCGRSQIRPFCDGTHKMIGFRAHSGAEVADSERGR